MRGLCLWRMNQPRSILRKCLFWLVWPLAKWTLRGLDGDFRGQDAGTGPADQEPKVGLLRALGAGRPPGLLDWAAGEEAHFCVLGCAGVPGFKFLSGAPMPEVCDAAVPGCSWMVGLAM